MGNQNEKKAKPEPTIEETILELKMASKRFEMDSKRSMKEKEQQLKKAKDVKNFKIFNYF